MAKPARTDTHTTTARTWQADLADGRRIQFSAPTEQLAARLTTEARTEHTTITAIAPVLPLSDWAKLHGEIVVRLCANKAMTINDGRADRAA